MGGQRHHPSPGRAALAVGGAALVALLLIGALAAGQRLRGEVSPTGDRLARAAAATPESAGLRPVETAQALAARTGASVRVLGPDGRVLAQAGPPDAWRRGDAALAGRLATLASGSWQLRAGAVEASGGLVAGRRVALRATLPPGVGTIDAVELAILGGAALLLAAIAGLVAGLAGRRRARRLERLTTAAEALAAGRPATLEGSVPPAWRPLVAALAAASERTGELSRAAELGVDGARAAIGPMDHPVALRSASGARTRNPALERLLDELPQGDALALEEAIEEGLTGRGPFSRRLEPSDGRVLEVESWGASGGRVVSVGERTEQQRLRALRLQLSGAAARQLQGPVHEIQAAGAELFTHVPARAGRDVRRLLAAADRMESLLGKLLRGTPHDPRSAPLRLRSVGVAGFLWGLAHRWDQALRTSALRVEVQVADGLPPVRTDPTLAEEVLAELIDNAAKFTQRGGTIRLAARATAEGGVALEVGDDGPGLHPADAAHATTRFFRGRGAEGLPGAGLGLGVAAALAERLGGRLVVDPGPGGRARLELPSATGNGGAPGSGAERALAGAAA
jgi:signal transduction histidine kinase